MAQPSLKLVVAGVGKPLGLSIPRVVAEAAFRRGLKVRTAETLGTAFFGRPNVTFVCIGLEASSGVVLEASGDLLVGLDPMEALRASLKYLSKRGAAIVNTRPLPVALEGPELEYPSPSKILKQLEELVAELYTLDAVGISLSLGSLNLLSSVMLGALASIGKMPLPNEDLRRCLGDLCPLETVVSNLKAFDVGTRAVKKGLEPTQIEEL